MDGAHATLPDAGVEHRVIEHLESLDDGTVCEQWVAQEIVSAIVAAGVGHAAVDPRQASRAEQPLPVRASRVTET